MKTVIVTGFSGVNNIEVAEKLSEQGWSIAVLMRHPENWADVELSPNIKLFKVSMSSKKSIISTFTKIRNELDNIYCVLDTDSYNPLRFFNISDFSKSYNLLKIAKDIFEIFDRQLIYVKEGHIPQINDLIREEESQTGSNCNSDKVVPLYKFTQPSSLLYRLA